jgi:hypothetical protein
MQGGGEEVPQLASREGIKPSAAAGRQDIALAILEPGRMGGSGDPRGEPRQRLDEDGAWGWALRERGLDAQGGQLRLKLIEQTVERVFDAAALGIAPPLLRDLPDRLCHDLCHLQATHRFGVEDGTVGQAGQDHLVDGVIGPVPLARKAARIGEGHIRPIGRVAQADQPAESPHTTRSRTARRRTIPLRALTTIALLPRPAEDPLALI